MRPRDGAESCFQLALVTLEEQPVGGGGDAVGGTGGQTGGDCRSVGGTPDSWCSDPLIGEKKQIKMQENAIQPTGLLPVQMSKQPDASRKNIWYQENTKVEQ